MDAPHRIAALMPDVAGVLLQLVEPRRLVLIPERSRIPVCSTNLAAANQVANVLPLLPRLDTPVPQVLALQPDLVVGSVYRSSHADALDAIEQLGTPVVRVDNQFGSLDAVARNAQRIAEAVGEAERCTGLLDEFHRTIAMVEERTWEVRHRPTVLALTHNGERLAVNPPNSMPCELIGPAGGIPADFPYGTRPRDLIEAIAGTNPECLILVDGFGDGLQRFADLIEHTEIPAIAARRFRIFPVNQVYPDAGLQLATGLDRLSGWLLTQQS